MPPSLLLLLLCCLWPVDCRPGHEASEKPTTVERTKAKRLAKADDGAKHSVIILSDDIDGEPDGRGEFTMATLAKPDLPAAFTVCTAFKVEAWTTGYQWAVLATLTDDAGDRWALSQ